MKKLKLDGRFLFAAAAAAAVESSISRLVEFLGIGGCADADFMLFHQEVVGDVPNGAELFSSNSVTELYLFSSFLYSNNID